MGKEKTFSGVKIVKAHGGYVRKIGGVRYSSFQFPAYYEAEVSIDMSKPGWGEQLREVSDMLFAFSFKQVERDIVRSQKVDKELAMSLRRLKSL